MRYYRIDQDVYLEKIRHDLKNKLVVDVPAGKGDQAGYVLDNGGSVIAFDLFPKDFQEDRVKCNKLDLMKDSIPVDDGVADMVFCFEGFEHFQDLMRVFNEFNRVLKTGGTLLISTPSKSSLVAKLNYLLFESEPGRLMPANEIDDFWKTEGKDVYYGHIFLRGLQELRLLAKLSNFNIDEIVFTRLSRGSLLLLPIFYPFILFKSFRTYKRHMKRDKGLLKNKMKESVYKEQLNININPKNLINRHTIIAFKKGK